ncbi:MAG: helix-turn-helix domain-containing protein [Gemmataceae bacterium]
MHRPLSKAFSSFVAVPECRPALEALERVDAGLALTYTPPDFNPLFLFGPAGCGKSHLCLALIDRATRRQAQLTVTLLSSGDWRNQPDDDGQASATPPSELEDVDLLVLEDVQHLPARRAEAVLSMMDALMAQGSRLIVTATCGPQQLALPARLVSRLAGGLVVGIEPLSLASRLLLLQELSQRQRIAIKPAALEWLARRLTGARQIEGSMARLQTLAKTQRGPLAAADLESAFRDDADSARLTVERIIAGVGGFYGIDPKQLRSKQRRRSALLPRQVSMYLARKLTTLPLQQIGSHFGGRDHATVLHACRKIEETLARDVALSGAVRHLCASLT